MFTVLDSAAHDHTWSLQLWACPLSPAGADQIAGHIIAEAPLPPISEIADDAECFAVNALATPPAGGGEHVLVLALVSRSPQSGEKVQDFAVYPQREYFFQPRLGGTVAYRVDNDRVLIQVDRLENPRFASNVSGTLALELWALPFAYEGGEFQGFPLSGVAFDAIPGNRFKADASFYLPFVPPPAGSWQLVLMLREWTPRGFVTRDFRNFTAPFQVESPGPATSTEAKEAPAPATPPGVKTTPPIATAPTPAAKPALKAAPVIAATPAVVAAPIVAKPDPAAARRTKASKTAQPGQTASVNTATVDKLAGLNGVSRTLAKAIVAGRPYSSFDDLLRVKGMGPKLLAKIRAGFRL